MQLHIKCNCICAHVSYTMARECLRIQTLFVIALSTKRNDLEIVAYCLYFLCVHFIGLSVIADIRSTNIVRENTHTLYKTVRIYICSTCISTTSSTTRTSRHIMHWIYVCVYVCVLRSPLLKVCREHMWRHMSSELETDKTTTRCSLFRGSELSAQRNSDTYCIRCYVDSRFSIIIDVSLLKLECKWFVHSTTIILSFIAFLPFFFLLCIYLFRFFFLHLSSLPFPSIYLFQSF